MKTTRPETCSACEHKLEALLASVEMLVGMRIDAPNRIAIRTAHDITRAAFEDLQKHRRTCTIAGATAKGPVDKAPRSRKTSDNG